METNNQKIAKFMGMCPCENFNAGKCIKCGKGWPSKDTPAYDSADSPRRLLDEAEAKCIETFGDQNYMEALGKIVRPDVGFGCGVCNLCAVASAKDRCAAIVAVIEGLEDKTK